jgi:hypothetical protein
MHRTFHQAGGTVHRQHLLSVYAFAAASHRLNSCLDASFLFVPHPLRKAGDNGYAW